MAAIFKVRLALMGHWQVGLQVPSFANNDPTAGSPPGRLYALDGKVTLKPESNLVAEDEVTRFDVVGTAEIETMALAGTDQRLRVRKTCGTHADCGLLDGEEGLNCSVSCSEETLICPYQAQGVSLPRPNGAACKDGLGGMCCEGSCLAVGEECAACN